MQTNTFGGAGDIGPAPGSDEKLMAILSHLLTFIAPIIAPLIIYLVKKDSSRFVEHHARESLNFQISMILLVILLFITVVGILFVWAVGIITLVFVIVAAVRAANGQLYKYPLTLRLLK